MESVPHCTENTSENTSTSSLYTQRRSLLRFRRSQTPVRWAHRWQSRTCASATWRSHWLRQAPTTTILVSTDSRELRLFADRCRQAELRCCWQRRRGLQVAKPKQALCLAIAELSPQRFAIIGTSYCSLCLSLCYSTFSRYYPLSSSFISPSSICVDLFDVAL